MEFVLQTVIQGQISPTEGLREALEIVLTVKNVQDGVLDISSEAISGQVGIFCGRYITGALTDNGESGNEALRKLLSVKSGKFSFLDTKGESHSELKQSLSVDLSSLLELSEDFSKPTMPLLDDSMTGYALQAAEQVFLSDAADQGDSAYHSEYDFAPQGGSSEAQQQQQQADAAAFDEPIQSRQDASRFDEPIQSRQDASRFDEPIQSRTASGFDQPVANPFAQAPQGTTPPVPPLPNQSFSQPPPESFAQNPFNQPSPMDPQANEFGQPETEFDQVPNPFNQPGGQTDSQGSPAAGRPSSPPVPYFNAELNDMMPNPFNQPPTTAPWSGQEKAFQGTEETDEGPSFLEMPERTTGPVAPPLPGDRGTFQRPEPDANNPVDLNAATVSWQAQQSEGVAGQQENWRKEQQKWELAMQAEENPALGRPDWKPSDSEGFSQGGGSDFSEGKPLPPQQLEWGEETWGELANKAIIPPEPTPPEDFSSMRRPDRKPDLETPRELSTLIDSDERDRFFNDNGDVPQRGSQTAHMARSSFQKSRQLGKKNNSLFIILLLLFLIACAITVFFGPQVLKTLTGGK